MTIEDRIKINAPIKQVWKTTIDVNSWAEWTPTVTWIKRVDEGPFRVGSTAYIKQPGLPTTLWTVTEMSEGREFTWMAKVLGMQFSATHLLEPAGDETTCTLRLRVNGLMAVLLGPLICVQLRKALAQENAGLKTKCEAVGGRVDQ